MRGCNCIATNIEREIEPMIVAFNYKFAKSNLPPNNSKINFNHANVFCSLFALNHRLLCNHVHCILRAAGERHARTVIDSNFFTIDLADPGFSPTIPCPFANYELAYWGAIMEELFSTRCIFLTCKSYGKNTKPN